MSDSKSKESEAQPEQEDRSGESQSEARLSAELPPEAEPEEVTQPEVVQPEVTPPARLPGAELLALRLQSGMTVEQMAARLKLTPRQILALEADNYTALPGMTIVRAFIRAYAKVLNVDPTPLVAMIPDQKVREVKNLAPTWRGMSTPYSETRLPTMGGRNPVAGKWMLAVLLIVLLIGALLVSRQKGWLPNLSRLEIPQKDKAESSASAPQIAKTTEASAAKAADSESGKLVQKELPPITPNQVLPATVDKAVDPAQGDKPADAVGSPEVVAPASSINPANVVNALVLKCNEQSWYEIRRANGNVVRSGLLQAGATESFEIVEPVQLTLGNAPGVEASFRGAPLEFRSEDGNKVVKLSLK